MKELMIKVEIGKVIKMLGEYLYPEKNRIVQELLKNSTDAIQLRTLSDSSFSKSNGCIKVGLNPPKNQIFFSDNGIGISIEQVELAFTSIGSSSKKNEIFEAATKGDEAIRDLVGGFGIGLLSMLIICDEFEICSKPLSESESFRVSLNSQGNFTISDAPHFLETGTTVTLNLNEDGRFLNNSSELEQIILRYSRLIPFPIYIDGQELPIWPGRQSRSLEMMEKDLSAEIEAVLSKEKMAFQIQPSIGGLKPDFVVYGPNGRRVILEAKNWTLEPGYLSRALQHIKYIKSRTDADAVFVVLKSAKSDQIPIGVTDLNKLTNTIKDEFNKPIESKERKPLSFKNKTVFAAMPFSEKYDDVFFVAMAPASDEIGAACIRVDKDDFSGDIVERIKKHIEESIAVIADLSESRPNVLYELGYAHALGKPVVHITSTSTSELPFDVRNWSTLKYEVGRTHKLREILSTRLKSILGQ